MRRCSLSLFLAVSLLLVAAVSARAFIGGSTTYGHCSATGVPCTTDPMCPCWIIGACGAGTQETCVANGVSGSDGESSAVQSAFYECKNKSIVPKVKSQEDTMLMLVNEHTIPLCACIVLYDGASGFITSGITDLAVNDVDEINICALTGYLAGGLTGKVEVVTASGFCPWSGIFQGGAYGWIKDVIYKGSKYAGNPNDPFSATVSGVGKTELRVTPRGVEDGSSFAGICAVAPFLAPPVYIENTFP